MSMAVKTREGSPSDELIYKEIFEENVYKLHGWMLSQGGIVLDIGANIGVFTMYAHEVAKSNGLNIKVIAVEPQPDNIALLEDNIISNNIANSTIVSNVAISTSNSDVYITNEHGGSRLTDKSDNNSTRVDVVSLERLLDKMNILSVDFAKIDIEGAEVDLILNTPMSTLLKVKRFAIEYDENSGGVSTFAKIIEKLGSNYSFSTLGVPARGCYIYAERHIDE